MSPAPTNGGRHPQPIRVLIAGLIAVSLVCGCGSAVPAPGAVTPSAIDPKPAASDRSPASSGPTAALWADDHNNGSTVALRRGQHLVLSLGGNAAGGTYWHITQPHPEGVVRGGPARVHPRNQPGEIAGSGVGTVVQEFTAAADGTTSINAHRTTCGEALRCSPDQATFTIRLVVTG